MAAHSFLYQAIDAKGKTVQGTVEAASEVQALRLLSNSGLSPTSVRAQRAEPDGAGTLGAGLTGDRLPRKVSDAQATQLLDELATLLESGVPLGEALPSLAKAYQGTALHVPLQSVHKAVRSGSGLGAALKLTTLPLPGYVLALLGAAEASGQMGPALHDAANQMKFEASVRQDIRNALTYPAVLVLTGVAAITLIFVAVVPRFASLLKSGKADLPDISRIVIHMGLFARDHMLLIGLGSLAAVLFIAYTLGQPRLRSQALDLLARWGPTRRWILPGEVGRWANLLGTLLANRVPLLQALALSRDLLKLPTLQRHLDQAMGEVRRGRALSDIFTEQGWLGPTQANMVRVGERSGELPRMLRSLGQQQSAEARQRIKAMLALLEPVAILIIGVVIGIIMVAVMLAITSLNTLPK